MLKTTRLLDKPAPSKNNSNKLAFSRNDGNRLAFKKNNGNNKVGFGGDNMKHSKKSEKSESQKMS